MKRIDHTTLRIVNSFGYSNSGKIFYRNLALVDVKLADKINCYVQIKGKYSDGEEFNNELKITYNRYLELFDQVIENVRRDRLVNAYNKD